MNEDRGALLACARSVCNATELALDEDALGRLVDYTTRLQKATRRFNLVGTDDGPRLVEEMVLDSAQLAPLLPTEGRLIDIGSGGGLPGLPVLLCLPGWSGVLLEPREKRFRFLQSTIRSMQLGDRVLATRGRLVDGALDGADSRIGEEPFDLAVSKAVFEPSTWLVQATDLVGPSGQIAIYAQGDADAACRRVDDIGEAYSITPRTYALSSGAVRTVLLARPTRERAR